MKFVELLADYGPVLYMLAQMSIGAYNIFKSRSKLGDKKINVDNDPGN